jgi:hypothetical protein
MDRPEGKWPIERRRHRWEDNVKMAFQEVGWGAWTGLIWCRNMNVNAVMNLWVP